MSTAILMCVLFFAKVVDNALSTTKTILVQRNHSILAGIALAASNFIYLCITKNRAPFLLSGLGALRDWTGGFRLRMWH